MESDSPARSALFRDQARLILLICAFVQFALADLFFLNDSFWYDEVFSAHAAEESLEFLFEELRGDLHPPGFFFLLWVWEKLVPHSEFMLRLVPLVFSIGTLFPLYLLVKRLVSREAGLWSCVVLTLCAFHQGFGVELRAYSAMEFFTVLSLLLMVRAMGVADRSWREFLRKAWPYALSLSALVYFHYYGFFIIVVQALALVIAGHWRHWKKWLAVFGGGALLFLPWLPVLVYQLRAGKSGWIDTAMEGLSTWGFLARTPLHFVFGEFYFRDRQFDELQGYLWPILIFLILPVMIAGVWLTTREKAAEKRAWLIPFVLLSVPALVVVVSQFHPVYLPRYMNCVVPLFCAVFGIAVAAIPSEGAKRSVGIMTLVFFGWGFSVSIDQRPIEDWREVTALIAEDVENHSGETMILAENLHQYFSLQYYLLRSETDLERVILGLTHDITSDPEAREGVPDRIVFVLEGRTPWAERVDVRMEFPAFRMRSSATSHFSELVFATRRP